MSHCSHGHAHPTDYNQAFAIGAALNLVYLLAEATCGIIFNSVSLLADAGHNLSDVLGLLLAWGAHRLAQIPPTSQRTYGWRSSTILAAMLNAIVLLIAMGGIAWESIRRLIEPAASLSGPTMMMVAGLGVVVNTATAMLFLRGRHEDLNIRGAFLHMAADAAVSLSVVVAGLLVMTCGWLRADPLVSLVIVVVIVIGTWGLLRDSLNLALAAVPSGIDANEVEEYLTALDGVSQVHDLHIWAMSTTETALTVHLVRPAGADDEFLLETSRVLRERFGIPHATIQIERDDAAAQCQQAPAGSL